MYVCVCLDMVCVLRHVYEKIILLTYRIAGIDIYAALEVIQNFLQVTSPGRSQETGVAISLEQSKETHN